VTYNKTVLRKFTSIISGNRRNPPRFPKSMIDPGLEPNSGSLVV